MKEENETDAEKDPTTWAYGLRAHFNAFSEGCWRSFNLVCDEMNRLGHENKLNKFKWREYVLWDMQQKHEEEMKMARKGTNHESS